MRDIHDERSSFSDFAEVAPGLFVGAHPEPERHYNSQGPHRTLDLRVPEYSRPVAPVDQVPSIEQRDVLGGLIHEYHAVAA